MSLFSLSSPILFNLKFKQTPYLIKIASLKLKRSTGNFIFFLFFNERLQGNTNFRINKINQGKIIHKLN